MGKTVRAIAAQTTGADLGPHEIERRPCGPHDVDIAIKFAGICHSDLHQVDGDWGKGTFPMVPGHEIVGIVTEVGDQVTKFKVGDRAGVGCMVDSCRDCESCRHDEEQYCTGGGMVGTYNSKFKYAHCEEEGATTYGGYSRAIVVDEKYVLSVPDSLDMAAAAPLLCAGITTYAPLVHFKLQPNQRYAVAGLGGLGHMGVRFGKAFGAHVTVISRGTAKKEDAMALGAHAYIDSTDTEAMKAAGGSLDFILDCIPAAHDVDGLMALLRRDGKLISVGAGEDLTVSPFTLLMGRKTLAGSLIGGIKQTQEMLDFCGRHGVVCDIELINADQVNEAYARTKKADVRYRFVIDAETI